MTELYFARFNYKVVAWFQSCTFYVHTILEQQHGLRKLHLPVSKLQQISKRRFRQTYKVSWCYYNCACTFVHLYLHVMKIETVCCIAMCYTLWCNDIFAPKQRTPRNTTLYVTWSHNFANILIVISNWWHRELLLTETVSFFICRHHSYSVSG